MRYIKIPFIIVWRVWFYLLVLVPILLLFPALLATTTKEHHFKYAYRIARFWSKVILFGMGFIPKIKTMQKLKKGTSYMLTANHTSMIDIMMMLYISKSPFVFIGKKELSKLPVFGFFYKRMCILVDRKSPASRRDAFLEAQRRLSRGTSICIFPEGGVPDDINIKLDRFKDGAFRLAIEHQIPIVPISFLDNKKRFRYQFLTGSPGVLRAVIHPFISTEDLKMIPEHKKQLKAKTEAAISSVLTW